MIDFSFLKTGKCHRNAPEYRKLSPAMQSLLQEYLESGHKSGLQNSTLNLQDKLVHYFLASVMDAGCNDPGEMNAECIGQACLRINSKWYNSHIRTFLRYMHRSGHTDRDYSCLVPLFKRPEPFPSVYTIQEIRRIEEHFDQSRRHGKRDYAMLLLATRLGIRNGDISGLTFSSLDFRNGIISIIQHKTGVTVEYPMVPDVKNALVNYIQDERPASDIPYVFLRLTLPYKNVSVQTIGKAVTNAILRAGIDPNGRKCGPHAFRSSLASAMVNDEVPYEVVRRTLGHSDPNTIRHYARLDIEHLRQYALPVPSANGSFAEFLEGRRLLK